MTAKLDSKNTEHHHHLVNGFCIYKDCELAKPQPPKTENPSQKELIDFIDDPKIIAKVVEGSMDKRNAVMNMGNEELDEKLREAIRYVANEDGYAEAEDLDEAVAKIKQIYADQVTPKVDALVQDMVNLHANMKYGMLRLRPTSTPVASSVVQPPNTGDVMEDSLLNVILKEALIYSMDTSGYEAQKILSSISFTKAKQQILANYTPNSEVEQKVLIGRLNELELLDKATKTHIYVERDGYLKERQKALKAQLTEGKKK